MEGFLTKEQKQELLSEFRFKKTKSMLVVSSYYWIRGSWQVK